MRLAVVVNPVGAVDERPELEAALGKRSIDATWIETSEEDPGVSAAKAAVADGAELVLACGGDGTVRAVAEGVSETSVPIGIIPAGTGNLLARNLEIPMNVEEALDVALSGDKRSLDAGEVEGEVFTVMAGAGVDAVIMDETSSEAKDRLGSLAYVIEGAKHIFDEPIEATVSAGDSVLSSGAWATILVGNLGRLQGGIDLFPDSKPGDGRLNLIGLAANGGLEAIAAGVAAATQSHSDRLLRATGTSFTIEFSEPVRYELDGEARSPIDRLEIRVRPGALLAMTPKSAT
ncbi:MAG: diacylglycerol kinase [Actinobacteria bacterium]|nr:MAG: diacylglycerol kinase [Actinomycetota bacterium]REK34434.1 MAG: diacylglycerol kinase [Actinomycetota bacterium]